jgi:Flp pilus assembly protein TadG
MNGTDLRKEQGAVAPLVAALMVGFILCIALVVDLGHLHNVKVQLQRAADAAALAGAGQLDGSSSQDSHAATVAKATAALNRVGNKTGLSSAGGWVDDASIIVTLGTWNPDHNETTRFTSPAATPNTANAVKVTATMLVPHYFFFFTDGTTIVTDAIAVDSHEDTAMPIALLSCIPSTSGIGSTIEDIRLYKFSTDPTDTAGWTALTYPISGNQLKYFFTQEGNVILNQILYGNGTHLGLENEPVIRADRTTYNSATACGDRNVELDIRCGLGDDFVSPPSPLGDPLALDPLPRWDNKSTFEWVWSMGGILRPGSTYGPGETAGNLNDPKFQTRMDALKNASATNDWSAFDGDPYPALPLWALDGRFAPPDSKRQIIEKAGGKTVVNYDQALFYAGYPEVQAKNGADNAVIQQFIELSTESGHFRNSLTNINPPLDATATSDPNNSYGGGETFATTIPVIFAGVCGEDGWKALKGKYYSGTANLLITRLWKGQNECYDAASPVTVYGSPPFDINAFIPKLNGDQYSCVTGSGSGAAAGFEALITPTGEEGPQGIKKIYLVE